MFRQDQEPGRGAQAGDVVDGAGERSEAGDLCRAMVRAFLTSSDASVETEAGEAVVARQAASCLLAPAIGDRVLVHRSGGEAFILAVLERRAERAAELAVPGAGDVTLAVAGRLDIRAQSLGLSAPRIDILAHSLMQAGENMVSTFKRITESVVDKIVGARTITTNAQSRTTAIKEVEVLEAGTLVQRIESVATQNSEIALITARRDVRLDGERVSVG